MLQVMMAVRPAARRVKVRIRVTVTQLRILLKAIEMDPSLYNVANSSMIAFLNIEKWLKLMDTLNGCYEGAMMNSQSWKYILRYWAANIKKGPDVMSKERLTYNKSNPALNAKEAKKLTRLERRFYNFLKREEAKEIVDVTYTGDFGIEQTKSDIVGASNNSVKVKLQLMNVSEVTNDENACPNGPKKRIIHVKQDDPVDPADVTKKLKIIFNENLEDGEPQKQILENQLDRLQVVSRELEEHISTIQSRIHMIKDLWKHRCGDN